MSRVAQTLANIGRSFREGWAQIDQYWFGYGSPVSLGLLRILIGLTTFFNLLITFGEFEDWYTERGFVPQWAAKYYIGKVDTSFWLFGQHQLPFSVPRLNLLSDVYDSRLTYAFFILTLIACLTMTLGLWSRISAIVLALGIVSLHHRNAMILHGGDTLQRVAVLYMALAPCGKACSLDRLIGLWKGKIKPGVVSVSLWPQRLITFNLAVVYFTTVWQKWRGNQWREGIATYFPGRLNEFKRFPVPAFMNDLPFVKIATYGTLATELSLATLVFYKPLRKWVLLAGLAMHGYIEYSMNIPLFSFTICSLYVTFFEGEEVTAWALQMGQRLRRFAIRVTLPAQTRLRPQAAATLAAMDPFALVSYEPGLDGWAASDIKGRPRPPFRASRLRSVGGWPTAVVPGLWRRMLQSSVEPVEAPTPQPEPARKAKAGR